MKFIINQVLGSSGRKLAGFALVLLTFLASVHAAGFLHASGQDIVDQDGNKILLRGVGLGNWMLPEGYMWRFGEQGDRPRKIEKIVSDLAGPDYAQHFWTEYRRNYVTESDIKRIAELGYNSVRPALNSRLFLTEDDKPAYVDEGFQLLDNLVKWSKKYGVYVIIDMHAAPGGQTGQNIDDSANNQPELFMDEKYQQRLSDLWVKIATRYKDEPTVAGYDILNEPLPQRTGSEGRYKSQLEPLYKQVTKAIRTVDNKHMIIVEGADWANDWSAFTTPFDQNMVYQFHYYCWDQPSVLKGIHQYLDYQKRNNVPVWVGETGESSDAIYWGTTDFFEAHNIGWSFWPWKKMAGVNAPYSYSPPDDWRLIREYVNGGGAKPSAEIARKAFDQLLSDIRITNCQFHPDVVNAMFHRVPGLVLAKNYSHDGPDKSYFVTATNHSRLYRLSEPVPVVTDGTDDGNQVVALAAGEWTAYTINCTTTTRDYETVARVRASDGPAEVQLLVDDQPCAATISKNAWDEISLGTHSLAPGAHHLKWIVKSGSVQLDWFNLKVKSGSRLSADSHSSVSE